MLLMRTLLIALLVVFLSGCTAKGRCHKVREYQKAQDGQELIVPEGLAPLDTAGKINVPEGDRNQKAVPRGEKCLDFPPEYFRKADAT